jgi:hypothetical protein
MVSMTATADDNPDPLAGADMSWAQRARELYEQGDVRTAHAEVGPEHMELFHAVISQAVRDPDLPRPGDPEWERFLAGLQANMEESLGRPLDSPPPPTVTATLTKGYGAEEFDPWK